MDCVKSVLRRDEIPISSQSVGGVNAESKFRKDPAGHCSTDYANAFNSDLKDNGRTSLDQELRVLVRQMVRDELSALQIVPESRGRVDEPPSSFELSDLLQILTKVQVGIYNVLSSVPQRGVDIAKKCESFCEPQTVRRYLVCMRKMGVIRQAKNKMYFR